MIIAIPLVLAIVVLSLSNIEWALWILIAVAATRGLLRQFYPAFATYLIVDVLIYLLLLHFVIAILRGSALKKETKPPLLTWLLLFAAVLTVYAFHPAVDVLDALSGLRARLLTVPLFLIGFYYFHSKASIVRLFHVAILVAVGVALFGIIQYQYGLGLAELAPSGLAEERYQFHYFTERGYGMRRAFSTFNSSHEFGMFLAIIMILTFGLIVSEEKRTRKVLYAIALLPMGIGLALSSTRSGIMMAVTGVTVQVLMLLKRQRIRGLLIVGGVAALVYIIAEISESLTAGFFSERVSMGFDPSYLYDRTFGYLFFVVWPNVLESPFGRGVSGTLGYIGRDLSSGEYNHVEGYYWNILYQTGIVGFVIVVILFAKILSLSYRAVTTIMPGWYRAIAVSLFGVILACAIENFAGGSMQAESIGVMFWLSVGILLKLGHVAPAKLRKDKILLVKSQFRCKRVQA